MKTRQKIHFIGCLGAGMRGLRAIAEADGAVTSGSDLLLNGHDALNAEGADAAVYSSAVPDDNPELQYARAHGIPLYSRAEFLGKIARGYAHTVAVAGSHGKTTATAMLWSIFAPLDPTVYVGGVYEGQCGRVGSKRVLITEACEYRRNFLHLLPQVSVVLNVELDHTDYYRDLADITDAFNVFSRSAPVRIVNGDDEASAPLRTGTFRTFGLGERNDFRAENVQVTQDGTRFTLTAFGRQSAGVRLKVLGRHNVYNALAAAAAANALGMRLSDIAAGLERFTGVERRLQRLGRVDGCDVYTDYAHHPRELNSMIASLREAGYERVLAVFQPHTYSRTQALLSGFVQSLSAADGVLLASVFAAREEPNRGASSCTLCRALLDNGVAARAYDTFFELNEAALRYIKKTPSPCAAVYCGAGDIDVAAKALLLRN